MFAGAAVWGHKLETLLHTLSSLKVKYIVLYMYAFVCVCVYFRQHTQCTFVGLRQITSTWQLYKH